MGITEKRASLSVTHVGLHTAATSPGVTDDQDSGYVVGDVWLDTSGPTVYRLRDATTDAASWIVEANNATLDAVRTSVSITAVGATHADTIAVTFKIINGASADVAATTPFRWWLSSSATTGAIHGTAADGGVSATTGLLLVTHTSGLIGDGVTDVNGDAVLSVNHAGGAQNYYLWVQAGNTVAATSTVLAIT